MDLACVTAIDSIVQSSALPLVERECREIEPSKVLVTIDVESRKALSTYDVSALEMQRKVARSGQRTVRQWGHQRFSLRGSCLHAGLPTSGPS